MDVQSMSLYFSGKRIAIDARNIHAANKVRTPDLHSSSLVTKRTDSSGSARHLAFFG